jgi:hypothetical protein
VPSYTGAAANIKHALYVIDFYKAEFYANREFRSNMFLPDGLFTLVHFFQYPYLLLSKPCTAKISTRYSNMQGHLANESKVQLR